MKFFLITMATFGLVVAAQLPDSATQGPNPQDIATPEPEYIDIDEPEPGSSGPASSPPQAPAPIQSRNFSPAQPRPIQRPLSFTGVSSNARHIAQSYSSPQRQYQPIAYHQQQPIVHQQPQVHHQQIVHQQPIVHHQQIVHQQPIVHHQPIVHYQQPILQQHQPITHHHSQQQLPGHSYSSDSGYEYRRPVYVRRIYRHRY